jgi:hypothetical protein
MGDTQIAADILDGVEDAIATVGWTLTVEGYTLGALNPTNPGIGRSKVATQLIFQGFVYDYDDKDIDGTNVLVGDRAALLSIKGFTASQLALISTDATLLDSSDSKRYKIINKNITKVAGVPVVAELQLRS